MAKNKTFATDFSDDRNFITSLARGLKILEVIAESETPDLSLGTIAQRVGLGKTTAWRLIHTLVKLNYLRQDPETRRFSIGIRVLSLGYAYFDSMDLVKAAKPFLGELAKRCGETVNMAIRDGDQILYVERIKTTQVVNINLHVGSRLDLYNTSMGRALVAYLPEEWVRDYLKRLEETGKGKQFTKMDGRNFFRTLKKTRAQGYAENNEDLAAGLISVASPVWNAADNVVAAVNIAAPTARLSMKEMKEKNVPHLLETTANISAVLGHREKESRAAAQSS